MKKITEVIVTLVGLLITAVLLIGGFWCLVTYLLKLEREQIERHKAETVGTVVAVGYRSKSYEAKLEYAASNGQGYEHLEPTSKPLELGEHYKIIYDYTDPSTAIVLPEPVFLPHQLPYIARTVGKVIIIRNLGICPDIWFSYSVDGEEIVRYQEFYDVSQFKVGQQYVVEYFLDNPRIAILCDDQPVE